MPPRFLDTEAESADAAMMAWAERQGIRGYMRPASFGQLRGAKRNLWSLLIISS